MDVTLEVIGAGFGRPGTMSLKVALEELGSGPCYHMTEVFENPEHVQQWEAAPFVSRMRQMKRVARMASDLVWEDVFDGRFEDRRYAIEVFTRWNEKVKKRVPAERLLVYEVKDGWEPLCDFLGVTVPEGEPFPHLNDAQTLRKMIRRRMALTYASLISGASLAVLALLYLRSRISHRRA